MADVIASSTNELFKVAETDVPEEQVTTETSSAYAVPYKKGQLIIADDGKLYYDPTVGNDVQDRNRILGFANDTLDGLIFELDENNEVQVSKVPGYKTTRNMHQPYEISTHIGDKNNDLCSLDAILNGENGFFIPVYTPLGDVWVPQYAGQNMDLSAVFRITLDYYIPLGFGEHDEKSCILIQNYHTEEINDGFGGIVYGNLSCTLIVGNAIYTRSFRLSNWQNVKDAQTGEDNPQFVPATVGKFKEFSGGVTEDRVNELIDSKVTNATETKAGIVKLSTEVIEGNNNAVTSNGVWKAIKKRGTPGRVTIGATADCDYTLTEKDEIGYYKLKTDTFDINTVITIAANSGAEVVLQGGYNYIMPSGTLSISGASFRGSISSSGFSAVVIRIGSHESAASFDIRNSVVRDIRFMLSNVSLSSENKYVTTSHSRFENVTFDNGMSSIIDLSVYMTDSGDNVPAVILNNCYFKDTGLSLYSVVVSSAYGIYEDYFINGCNFRYTIDDPNRPFIYTTSQSPDVKQRVYVTSNVFIVSSGTLPQSGPVISIYPSGTYLCASNNIATAYGIMAAIDTDATAFDNILNVHDNILFHGSTAVNYIE